MAEVNVPQILKRLPLPPTPSDAIARLRPSPVHLVSLVTDGYLVV